nr:diguanylate cyclase [Marinobacter sp. X15-166B]
MILPQCELAEARGILDNICRQFSGLAFSGAHAEFQVTLSAGVARLNDFADADAALNAADAALYQRKQQGRNGVTVHGEGQLT